MNIKQIKTDLGALMGDRPLLFLQIGVIVTALLIVGIYGVQVQPRELQIATHYSSFGETGLYRNKWYYMVSFLVFVVLIAATHVALAAKLRAREMRAYAVLIGWLTITVLLISALVMASVFGIAYPGA